MIASPVPFAALVLAWFALGAAILYRLFGPINRSESTTASNDDDNDNQNDGIKGQGRTRVTFKGEPVDEPFEDDVSGSRWPPCTPDNHIHQDTDSSSSDPRIGLIVSVPSEEDSDDDYQEEEEEEDGNDDDGNDKNVNDEDVNVESTPLLPVPLDINTDAASHGPTFVWPLTPTNQQQQEQQHQQATEAFRQMANRERDASKTTLTRAREFVALLQNVVPPATTTSPTPMRRTIQLCHGGAIRRNVLRPLDSLMTAQGMLTERPQLLPVDDMVPLAQRFFEMQDKLRKQGRPFQVDVAYHYTQPAYMNRIRSNGLMNKQELSWISDQCDGIAFLPSGGILTRSVRSDFHRHGVVGLMVLRLKGTVMALSDSGMSFEKGCNAILMPSMMDDGVLLESGSQCLPILEFSKDTVVTHGQEKNGRCPLQQLEAQVASLLDDHFNKASPVVSRTGRIRGRGGARVARKAGPPSSVVLPAQASIIAYEAPLHIPEKSMPWDLYTDVSIQKYQGPCSICLEPLELTKYHETGNASLQLVRLKACGHEFHEECAIRMIMTSPSCGICRRPQRAVYGKMPSGTMIVQYKPTMHCNGFENVGTFVIDYNLPSGMQKMHHPTPGLPHPPLELTTLISHTLDGIRLVGRLEKAFRDGLTFRLAVLHDEETGESRVDFCSDIPSKAFLTGGLSDDHGYPDETFFRRCNDALNRLGVEK